MLAGRDQPRLSERSPRFVTVRFVGALATVASVVIDVVAYSPVPILFVAATLTR